MMVEKKILPSAFIQSWKALDRSLIHIVLLDFVYYAIFLFAGSFYVYKVLPQFLQLLNAASLFRDEIFGSTDEFVTSAGTMLDQWSEFRIYTISIALLLFANYVIFKYFIWLKIQKKQYAYKKLLMTMGHFAFLNFTVMGGILLFLVISYYSFVLETFNIFFFFVAPVLFIYCINILHPLFVMTEHYGEVWKLFWEIGVKKFYFFIIAYIIMIAGTIATMWIVTWLLFLPSALYFVWYVLCFAGYFTWTKYYMYEIIKKVKTEKEK